ncbi:MAG: hypothetical protein ACI89U_002243 [Gammaproteobacteria bacterium]|jgi:hypothetical protein
MMLPINSSPVCAGAFEEHPIKAAFLFNFPHFVKWPNENSKSTPLTCRYCVLQNGAVENALGSPISLSRNKKIQQNYIEPSELSNLSDCEILYLGENNLKTRDELLELTKGQSILTVSDQTNFVDGGGMIELVRQGSRVQVYINLESINEQGFDISSKLLSLSQFKASDKRRMSND